ncbi:unnamed protein product [Dimorphilus gyrociliatus]|uniref:Uncharacterized protein n=1 Tax=Dimorphilus gyrociliatus TaxID=2664684 RepID=A0A7I8VHW4_9ANNE|nr:unnamed protein product [Dimorphilus gyrociliatus]
MENKDEIISQCLRRIIEKWRRQREIERKKRERINLLVEHFIKTTIQYLRIKSTAEWLRFDKFDITEENRRIYDVRIFLAKPIHCAAFEAKVLHKNLNPSIMECRLSSSLSKDEGRIEEKFWKPCLKNSSNSLTAVEINDWFTKGLTAALSVLIKNVKRFNLTYIEDLKIENIFPSILLSITVSLSRIESTILHLNLFPAIKMNKWPAHLTIPNFSAYLTVGDSVKNKIDNGDHLWSLEAKNCTSLTKNCPKDGELNFNVWNISFCAIEDHLIKGIRELNTGMSLAFDLIDILNEKFGQVLSEYSLNAMKIRIAKKYLSNSSDIFRIFLRILKMYDETAKSGNCPHPFHRHINTLSTFESSYAVVFIEKVEQIRTVLSDYTDNSLDYALFKNIEQTDSIDTQASDNRDDFESFLSDSDLSSNSQFQELERKMRRRSSVIDTCSRLDVIDELDEIDDSELIFNRFRGNSLKRGSLKSVHQMENHVDKKRKSIDLKTITKDTPKRQGEKYQINSACDKKSQISATCRIL